MGEQMEEKKPVKHICAGLLAHVDAGKTTLSEALLYLTGMVRKMGRVDRGDAFLDTFRQERERGITIFAKQAVFPLGDIEVTLLDTPGHVDFSAETERTLQVLDHAILLISATDGVQGHTLTLWKLLRDHRIPTFLFVNKMDLPHADDSELLEHIREQLGDGCVDFTKTGDVFYESVAMTDETLLEQYLDAGTLSDEAIASAVARCAVTPVSFGAALHLTGVEEFAETLRRYICVPPRGAAFGARVFKIGHDERNTRLTWLKVTGGVLHVKDTVENRVTGERGKVDQVRVYSGEKYKTVQQMEAGGVCVVTGLNGFMPGDSLGDAPRGKDTVHAAVFSHRLLLPEGCDPFTMLPKLRMLEEEDPTLDIVWDESKGELYLQIMGQVQLEVLTELIAERFGVRVEFDEGHIVYRETIAAPVIGIGHFEPLRHYAEVHILMEPLPRGAGLQFASVCDTDSLSVNWQNLILTHLAEKTHKGVLMGSPLTDVRFTLIAGRAHPKHTEGGDFRQAVYRAVRQGLMGAENVLLEPWCEFSLSLPRSALGRAMNDMQRMGGTWNDPVLTEERAELTGKVSAAAVRGYQTEVAAYTKGLGRFTCAFCGYDVCTDAASVIAASGYDPLRDTENPADSVFCTRGAGVTVPWSDVARRAHIDTAPRVVPARTRTRVSSIGEKELEEIFVRTYGPIKNRGMDALAQSRRITVRPAVDDVAYVHRDEILLVDGYNIIFAWDELSAIARENLDAARAALIHILCNYQGMRGCRVIVIFDAYRVEGGAGGSERDAGVEIVYTKEGETADAYIERLSYQLGKEHRVKVATGDGTEQLMVLGHGARRMTAQELKWEVEQVGERIRAFLEEQR